MVMSAVQIVLKGNVLKGMFYVFNILKGKAPLKVSVSSYMLKCDYSPVDDSIVATCESNKHIFRK